MTTNNLISNVMASHIDPVAEVGQGGTVLYWTDREAVTVIAVAKNGREITVQADKAIRTDPNGMSDAQSYRYEPDPEGRTWVFSLRSNARWVRKGESAKSGTRLSLGHRSAYHDYSF